MQQQGLLDQGIVWGQGPAGCYVPRRTGLAALKAELAQQVLDRPRGEVQAAGDGFTI
jgi:hypothetical protein